DEGGSGVALKKYEADPIWDIEAIAAEAAAERACREQGRAPRKFDERGAWWCSPPAVRMSTLRSQVLNLPAGLAPDEPESFAGLLAVCTRPLDRISLWITSVTKTGDLFPPEMNLQLRVGFDCVSTIATTQVIQVPTWVDANTGGFLFQWSGLLVTQFELWGVLTEPASGATPIEVYFALLVDHVG